MHPFIKFVNPEVGELLHRLNMDKTYVRGEGVYLYDDKGKRYLDMIAAYGALPFGFNPPEIWEAIIKVLESREPSFVQPSYLEAAGELAKRLIQVSPSGLQYVTFANSGTEAVEAAIKLCRAATKKMGILATTNSFHGKTLGSLSATGRSSYQEVFGAPIAGFHFIPFGDAHALEAELSQNHEKYAAFLVEPIQGEGGIVVPPAGYLKAVREICSRYGVLLVLDEIQSGLGRTGRLFACEEEEVSPDVMVIAKALGGGIVPVGACICSEEVYNEEFATKHSSTFAGNTLACRVGLATLDLLTRDDFRLVRQVASRGERLRQRLLELRQAYPEILVSVRGRGLMLGLEFPNVRRVFPRSLLGFMAEQEMLTPMISSHLLNVEGVRVAPTLNGADIIRIEPPLIISEDQCDEAVQALDRTLKVLSTGNTASFLRHLVGNGERSMSVILQRRAVDENPLPSDDPAEGRFAFLVHPLTLKNYSEYDESLSVFTEQELGQLAARWNDIVDPFVLSSSRVESRCGSKAYGEFIAVPRTADELLAMSREQVVEELGCAVRLAAERGAGIVGLGAFTAVASRAGLYLKDLGVPLTTGNSYTVVVAVEAVLKALSRLETDPRQSVAAVVGATGSIGRGTSILLSEDVLELILIGNPKREQLSRFRLSRVAADILRHLARRRAEGKKFAAGTLAARVLASGLLPDLEAPLEEYLEAAAELEREGGPLVISTDLDATLPRADVVITATSATTHLVTPGHLKYGAVVCDLSRPANVSQEVHDARSDVLVIDGGVVEVPGRPSMGWDFGFEQGLVYACMAETMMLALEHQYRHTSIGTDIPLESILHFRDLAAKHGFRLADLRSFDLPLTEEEWERVLHVRKRLRDQQASSAGRWRS